jgi:hypothetical protein
MDILDAAKRIAHYPQGITGIAGLVLFFLFAGTVVWLHRVAEVDAPTLGASAWADQGPTEDRIKRTLDAALNLESLAAKLAGEPDVVARIGGKDESYVNEWKGLSAIAEALTADAPKQLLATLWTGHLSSARIELQKLARAGLAAASDEGTAMVTAVHERTLNAVIDSWLSIELSPSRVESLLADGSAKAVDIQGTNKKAAKAPTSPSAISALVEAIRRTSRGLLVARIRAELATVVSMDLDPLQAQSAIAGSVHKDFAARWMWVVSASLFLTLAVLAVAGAVPRLMSLVEKPQRVALTAVFTGAGLVAALVGQRFVAEIGPGFLSAPIRSLALNFGSGLPRTVTLLNALAAAAIAALLVTAWASFLIPTRDEDHLDVQFRTLRWVLHTSTLVLIAGVFETYALIHWPTVMMAEPAANMVESGALTASVAVGVALSTLLLLIYVPGAIALTEEARRRQRADETRRDTIEAIITRNGFDTSATKQIATFAQLLLPLIITAPLSQIVSLVGS